MKTEFSNLTAEKDRLLAEYKAARTEAQEYDTVKQNVDALLNVPKEQAVNLNYDLEQTQFQSLWNNRSLFLLFYLQIFPMYFAFTHL
ncbi:MAG: hypothetical protein Q4D90_05420 [bacterium]|nr:hypothetical protein [bacterium]